MGNIYSGDWKFNDDVAMIFDEHIRASVPLYQETQKLICNIISQTYTSRKGIVVTDLGTATGDLIKCLDEHFHHDNIYYCYDNSQAMLNKAAEKCSSIKNIKFIAADIRKCTYPLTDVFLLVYTLQFIPVSDRQEILERIYEKLNSHGMLIVCEKIISSYDMHNDNFIKIHEKFKQKQGFSKQEIIAKKKSLKNVMWTIQLSDYYEMLNKIGFNDIEIFFKWCNFVGIIAYK